MNSQTSTKNESLAKQKECGKHLCYETKSKHTQCRSLLLVSGSFEKGDVPRIPRVISAEELATMSKHNLREITFVFN